jgi:hypothetical protein
LIAGQILEGGSEEVAEGAESGLGEGEGSVTPLAGGGARRGRRG